MMSRSGSVDIMCNVICTSWLVRPTSDWSMPAKALSLGDLVGVKFCSRTKSGLTNEADEQLSSSPL